MLKYLTIFFLYSWVIEDQFCLCNGVIIPPRWANETLNPCARESWKLLHWPEDGRCYNIFSQGPCRATEEVFYDENVARASCRCSKGAAWHSKAQRCYNYFSKGPCDKREYFALIEDKREGKLSRPFGECITYKHCSPGYLFWPPTQKCLPHLSRGPCLHGSLLYDNPETDSTECGCNIKLMATNYWKHSRSCHELYTKGPCIDGHIFIYNLTSGNTECACGPHLITNYHKQTNRCYELDTIGPCRPGHLFTYNSEVKEALCSCLPGYVKWPSTGNCFRIFTRGPCSPGSYLYPHEQNTEIGKCNESTCLAGELYDPQTKLCYPVGKRGPCNIGKLWIFERATSIRGLCHCDPQLIGYWNPHKICYELGERGPCPKRKVVSLEKNSGSLHCKCDTRNGFVSWVNGRCIKVGIQRNKLIPVAEPIKSLSRGNNFIQGRIHRGLTLPVHQRFLNISSSTCTNLSCPEEGSLKGLLSEINKFKNRTNSANISTIRPQAQMEEKVVRNTSVSN